MPVSYGFLSLFMHLGELSGEEYKKQLINSLCSSRWVHVHKFQMIFHTMIV